MDEEESIATIVPKLRVVGWKVEPVIMLDDGDTLTPTTAPPQMILTPQWEQFKRGGDDDLINIYRQQIEDQTP